jgi:hypothetical protein
MMGVAQTAMQTEARQRYSDAVDTADKFTQQLNMRKLGQVAARWPSHLPQGSNQSPETT